MMIAAQTVVSDNESAEDFSLSPVEELKRLRAQDGDLFAALQNFPDEELEKMAHESEIQMLRAWHVAATARDVMLWRATRTMETLD
jgi:hypothetical protein